MPQHQYFKVRDKLLTQMTKDGLVRTNKETGAAERISQREADTAFVTRIEHITIGRRNHKFKKAEVEPQFDTQRSIQSYSFKAIQFRHRLRHETSRPRLKWSAKELPGKDTYEPPPTRLRWSTREIAEEQFDPNTTAGKQRRKGKTAKQRAEERRDSFYHNSTDSAGDPQNKLLGAVQEERLPSSNDTPQTRRHIPAWIKNSVKDAYGVGKWAEKKVGRAAVQFVHKKMREVENDNIGVKAAHQTELAAEFVTRVGVRNVRSLAQVPQKLKRRKERKKLKKDNRDYIRKQRKRRWSKSNSQPVSEKLKEEIRDILVRIIRAIRKKLVEWLAKALSALGAMLGATGILVVLLFVVMSCTSVVVTTTATALVSYLAEDQDIHDASVLVTLLEAELDKQILDLPTAPEWSHIDEFRYDLDPIGHNPFVLMAWLTTKFDDFLYSDVETFLRELHNARYDLQLVEEVEVRERTYTDEDGEEHTEYYNYYILNVILRSKSIEEIIQPEIDLDQTGEFQDRYDAIMETKGNRQIVANPFDFDWSGGYSSIYGQRVDPLGSGNLQFHRGLDIPQPEGTPLRAGVTGIVIETGYNDTFGNFIIIQDEKGETTVKYAHCHELLLPMGASITAGESIVATVGNTGGSTGSHVHIEVKVNGQYLNPIYAVEFEPKKE